MSYQDFQISGGAHCQPPRQDCTTQKAFPTYDYINFALPSVVAQAVNRPCAFFAAIRHAMGSCILAGSQKFTLIKNVSKSLVGRTAIVELEGLSALGPAEPKAAFEVEAVGMGSLNRVLGLG